MPCFVYSSYFQSFFIFLFISTLAPDGVRGPVSNAINSTALNITWNAPGRANGIIISYQLIGIYPANLGSYRQVAFEVGMHQYGIVSNLEPYTRYRFKLVVTGSGGKTESRWTNVTTPEDSKCLPGLIYVL